jgi:rhamnogalacturonan endolyase
VVDDNGRGLWSTGLGHPDRIFVTDVDPSRPGLEVFYAIENPHPENSVCLVDARTGNLLWGIKQRTYHIGSGMCADIDPALPGMECWAAEDSKGDPNKNNYGGQAPRFMFSAKGELQEGVKVPPFSVAYWDKDLLREIIGNQSVFKYKGPTLTEAIEGRLIGIADMLGDWREEIITCIPGELRIYTTILAAGDRRFSLMQDPIYRLDVAHQAMGYFQPPVPGFYLGSDSANNPPKTGAGQNSGSSRQAPAPKANTKDKQ